MIIRPIRDGAEQRLQAARNKVMTGDDVVPYAEAMRTAEWAARCAAQFTREHILKQYVPDGVLSAAATILSQCEDWDQAGIETACDLALDLAKVIQLKLYQASQRSDEDAETARQTREGEELAASEGSSVSATEGEG